MPSGRTHDSITLWSLPLIAGVTYERTRSASLTLILSGGYLFSGLMFGPDLDIHSQQYKRWGILRWIWLPYRKSMRHRSFLSHGPIVGTLVRLVYLASWAIAALGLMIIISAIVYQITGESDAWRQFVQQYGAAIKTGLKSSFYDRWVEWVALFIGLELGALSHISSDWIGSRWKRLSKQKSSKFPKAARASDSHKPTPLPSHPSQHPTVELPQVPPSSSEKNSQ